LHLSILKAGYRAEHISSVNFLIRTMADNIFSNLSSALDALSYEINHLYDFKIPPKKVQINHRRCQQTNERDCVRCKLNNISNDDLSKFLDTELPREPIPQNHWYSTFSKYRNQVTHRLSYLILRTLDGSFLPNDPSAFEPIIKPYYDRIQHKIIIPNYTESLDIKDYCQSCLDKVLYVAEHTYGHLESKI
jgi:hypothetical protein